MQAVILVGTAGFSYADWRGVFYPGGLPQSQMLEYYTRRFAGVELDYTYYRMPVAKAMAAMVERTPQGFEFCVKAYKGMTHERPASEDDARDVFGQFQAALLPLRDAGRLGCVLLQFPWSFRCTGESAEYLRRCSDWLAGMPAVVEFRNAEWVRPAALDRLVNLLGGLGFGFCAVDEPQLKGLMPPVVAAAGDLGYVRFHGRNARRWWKHDTASERYDYLYSTAELADWAEKIKRLAGEVKKTYVFFNNCHAGQAATNATEMQGLLGLEPPSPTLV